MREDHSHDPKDIEERLNKGPKVTYLREWVYGGIDGVVTTFAVVAAVIGAELSTGVVLVVGLANLLGDGFSMAAAAFSGSKAEANNYWRVRKMEERHIQKYREGEIEETRQLLKNKGYKGKNLQTMLDLVTSDKKRWIDFMMVEEHGMSEPLETPFKIGMHTFIAFVICGSMSLWPFVLGLEKAHILSLLLAGWTFFAIGSLKSVFSIKPWWKEGIETFLIGMSAAVISYSVGVGLKAFIG